MVAMGLHQQTRPAVVAETGAKTGQERANPVNWFPGPDGSIDVKADQFRGAEREQAWNDISTSTPQFKGYQEKTDRELPIIRLIPSA